MDPISLVVIVLVIAWILGYFGYGRTRWELGRGADLTTLLVVLLLLIWLFGWPRAR